MKKTIFSIIIALSFNLFASAGQPELQGLTCRQSMRMAQINQWNNMLPYAMGAGALGLAAAAGVSYRYYRKYDANHQKEDRALTQLNKELKPKNDSLKVYSWVTTALTEMDATVQCISDNRTQASPHIKTMWDLFSKLDFSDKSRLHSQISALNSAIQAQDITKFSRAVDALKTTIKDMQQANNQRIAVLNSEVEQPNKDKKTMEEAVAAANRKKAITKWIGIGCGIGAAGISLASIYSWFNRK